MTVDVTFSAPCRLAAVHSDSTKPFSVVLYRADGTHQLMGTFSAAAHAKTRFNLHHDGSPFTRVQLLWKTQWRNTEYYFSTGNCPAGEEVATKDECQTAYDFLNAQQPSPFKYPSKRGVLSLSDDGVPKYCSIQFQGSYVDSNQDCSPHFNTNGNSAGAKLSSGEYRALCIAGDAYHGRTHCGQDPPSMRSDSKYMTSGA